MWQRRRIQTIDKTAKLDTWVYSFRTLDVEDGRTDGAHDMFRTVERKVQIDFLCEKTFLRTSQPPFPLRSIKFVVECKELELKFTGTDGEALRQVIFGAIDERVKVKWEPWLRINVEGERHWNSNRSEGFSLGYKEIERGRLADGRYVRKEGTTLYAWDDDDTHGLIPDTSENRQKLDSVFEELRTERRNFEEKFSPANIAQTLSLSGFTAIRARPRSRS